MTGTSTHTYKIDNVVRGHHVYKAIWTPLLGEMLNVEREDKNDHDEYSVAIAGRGHSRTLPREISRIYYYLMKIFKFFCTLIHF